MRRERGQASVEWVAALLLVALALTALGHFAGRVDAAELATSGLRATRCALAGCAVPRAPATLPQRSVITPPLLPPPAWGGERGRRGGERGRRSRPRGARPRGARPRSPSLGPFAARARASARVFWRRAWLACFAYERVRYGLLHPENVRQTIPLRDVVQMVNDCVSPFDLARDWDRLRP